jgi:hypothetical protein
MSTLKAGYQHKVDTNASPQSNLIHEREGYEIHDFFPGSLGTGTDGERYGKAAEVRETAIAYGDETWVKKDGSTGR